MGDLIKFPGLRLVRTTRSYKKGDEVILGVKDKHGNTKDWRGVLGSQDIKTGEWYVMTPDWQGMASEKSFKPAPKKGPRA